jgi:hypothetical protein
MSARRQPQPHNVLDQWGWSPNELAVVAVWLEIGALLVIWLS